MKFGQFMSYYKRKLKKKNSTKTDTLKLVPGSFVSAKNQAQPILENETFEATCLY